MASRNFFQCMSSCTAMSLVPASAAVGSGVSVIANETLSLDIINHLFARSANVSEEYARYAVLNDTRVTSAVVPFEGFSASFLNSVFGLSKLEDPNVSPFVRAYWDDLPEEEKRKIGNRMVYFACRQSTSQSEIEQCIRNERRSKTVVLSVLSGVMVTGVAFATLPVSASAGVAAIVTAAVGSGLATLMSSGITVSSVGAVAGALSTLSIPVALLDNALDKKVAYLVNGTTLSANALQFRLDRAQRGDGFRHEVVRMRLYERIINMTSELERTPWHTDRAVDLRRGIFQAGYLAKAFSSVSNSFWNQTRPQGPQLPPPPPASSLTPPSLPASFRQPSSRDPPQSFPSKALPASQKPYPSFQQTTTVTPEVLAVFDIVQSVEVAEQITTPVGPEPAMTPQEQVLMYVDQVTGLNTTGPQVIAGLDAIGNTTAMDMFVELGNFQAELLECASNLLIRLSIELVHCLKDLRALSQSRNAEWVTSASAFSGWKSTKRFALCVYNMVCACARFVEDAHATPAGKLILFVLALVLASFKIWFTVREAGGFFQVGWVTLQTALRIFQGMSVRMDRGMSAEDVAEEIVGCMFTLPVLLRDVDVRDPAVHKNAPRAIRKYVGSQPTPPPVTRSATRQAARTKLQEETVLALHQLMDPTLPPTESAEKNFLTSPLASELQDKLLASNDLPSSVRELINTDRKAAQTHTHASRLRKLQLLATLYAL